MVLPIQIGTALFGNYERARVNLHCSAKAINDKLANSQPITLKQFSQSYNKKRNTVIVNVKRYHNKI